MQLTEKYQKQLNAHLKNANIARVFADIQAFDLNRETEKFTSPEKSIYVGTDLQPAKCFERAIWDGAMHFVQENREELVYDLFAASVMLKSPQKFLANPFPFFMNFSGESNLEKSPYRSKTIEISATEDKLFTIFGLKKFFQESPMESHNYNQAISVADELMTNALFHGPVDESGSHYLSKIPRNKELQLPKGKKIKVFIGQDNKRIIVGCQDPFGTLDHIKVMRRLYDLYSNSKTQIDHDRPSAGLGLKMAIDQSIGFYVAVKRNVQTLVCCAIPISLSTRKTESYPKNFHFCAY